MSLLTIEYYRKHRRKYPEFRRCPVIDEDTHMTVTAESSKAPSPQGVEQTPCLVIDVDVARSQYGRIASVFAGAHIHYAVKANPELPLLRALVAAGCRFDFTAATVISSTAATSS